MSAKIYKFGGVVMLLAASVCTGQQPANPQEGQEPKPGQTEVRKQHAGRPEGVLQVLTKELNLDEAQQAEVKRLLDEQRSREYEARTTMHMPQELVEKMAGLRQEMRQARETGDNEKLRQVRDALVALQKDREEAMKPVQEKVAEMQEQLHDQILTILRDDQKAKFEDVWEEHMASRGGYGGPVRSPRALKAQIDKLQDLTPDQKQQIESLFDQFRKTSREPQNAGLKQRNELTKKLYDDVFALLTPEQKDKTEKALQGNRGGPRNPGLKPIGKAGEPGQAGQAEQEQQPAPPEGEQPIQ